MGNNGDDIYDRSRDPAGIKHESYSAGISKGFGPFSGYGEVSVEEGEPSLNTGVNISSSKGWPIYHEEGVNEEISFSKDGVETSTNYFHSKGVAVDFKKNSVYAEKTTYVNKNDVDRYNERVKEYEKLQEHPMYKNSRAEREYVNHEYNDCIHPYDYNKEFNIPKQTKPSTQTPSPFDIPKNRMDSLF